MRVNDDLEGGVIYESTPVNDFVEIKEDLEVVRQILEEQQARQIEQEQQEKEEEKQQEQEKVEQEQEQEQEQDPVIDLTFLDPCDHTLYLSSEVQYANINDLYSMALSIRNILLLFFLFFCVFKLSSMLKAMLYKIMNR